MPRDLYMPSPYWFRRWLIPFHRQPQGRNLAGKVGLFPESYTQPAPPSTGPSPANVPSSSGPADKPQSSAPSLPGIDQAQLQSLPEGSSRSATTENVTSNKTTTRANGEVMQATMTDVQKAIEQLGHKYDFDGSRSGRNLLKRQRRPSRSRLPETWLRVVCPCALPHRRSMSK